MSISNKANQTWRRGELMAELFLQDLGPQFLARADIANLAFDFFAGFSNPRGGFNTFAVEVKATEQPIRRKYRLKSSVYNALAYSNLPVLLLVVDVKENQLYFAWPCDDPTPTGHQEYVSVPVTLIDDETKDSLVARMHDVPSAR